MQKFPEAPCNLSPHVPLASTAERQPWSQEEFGQCQLNSRPLLHQGKRRVLSCSLPFYKTARGKKPKTRHLLPQVPCSVTEPFDLNCLTAETFCQRCLQLTWCTVLFSQFPCKIGIAWIIQIWFQVSTSCLNADANFIVKGKQRAY